METRYAVLGIALAFALAAAGIVSGHIGDTETGAEIQQGMMQDGMHGNDMAGMMGMNGMGMMGMYDTGMMEMMHEMHHGDGMDAHSEEEAEWMEEHMRSMGFSDEEIEDMKGHCPMMQ